MSLSHQSRATIFLMAEPIILHAACWPFERMPGAAVEVLTPDFLGKIEAIDRVSEVNPAVFNHNIETVPRLYRVARGRAEYTRSLALLSRVKQRAPHIVTKAGLMLGIGETIDELFDVLADLRVDFDIHRLELAVFILRNLNIHAVAQLQLLRLHGLVCYLDREDSGILSFHVERLGFQYPNNTLEGLGGRRAIGITIAFFAASGDSRNVLAAGRVCAWRVRPWWRLAGNRLPNLGNQRHSHREK